jgi:hypothetical protein
MSSKNPFNGDKKAGKDSKAPSQKANDAARRVQQESGGNKSGIGQRKGRPAPKPGVERSGGSGSSSGSGGKSSTTPRLPRNRPDLPKSGSSDGSTARRGCSLPFGILGVLSLVGVFALTQWF